MGLLDYIGNKYDQYKQSEMPAAYLLRGDYQGFPQALKNNVVNSSYDLLTSTMRGEDLPIGGGLGTVGTSAFKSAFNPKMIKSSTREFGFDPRFDPRALEQEKLRNLTKEVESYGIKENLPNISLADYEGYPFITSMSDRTGTEGLLTTINGIRLNRPVAELGGQGHMFLNPEQVWASGEQPVNDILRRAYDLKLQTGKNPIYLPWQMSPAGGDFSNMTGEVMLNYADTVMTKTNKKDLDKAIKEIIPDWKGVSDPKSISQYNSASFKDRSQIQQIMDRDFRDKGSLGIGEARLAVSDPSQWTGKDGSLLNIGIIDPNKGKIMESGHPAYPRGIPGEGKGVLDKNISVYQLLPDEAAQRGLLDLRNPRTTDLRALQMKSYGGILTPEKLKAIGY